MTVKRADGAPAIILAVIGSAIFALPVYVPQTVFLRLLGLPAAIALFVYSGYLAGESRRRLIWTAVAVVTTCVVASSLWATISRPLWEPWMRSQIGDPTVNINLGWTPMIDGLRAAAWALAVSSIGVWLRMRKTSGAIRAELASSGTEGPQQEGRGHI